MYIRSKLRVNECGMPLGWLGHPAITAVVMGQKRANVLSLLFQAVLEELEKKNINYPAFRISEICPASDASEADAFKARLAALKRSNARCYAMVIARGNSRNVLEYEL